jgi:glycosyltransferase involved in cell wall biosynthesis
LARSVNTFIYNSNAVAQCYREQGIAAGNGNIVYNPIDTESFGQTSPCSELRSEFGLSNQVLLISNVGRPDWWKGHDYFVQAIAEVARERDNIAALIVGQADTAPINQAHYTRLRQLVTELHLSDRVIFTGFRTDIPRIMAASDILVHSASEPEPFGRVVVEGMAAGRPVIATAAGGVTEIIQDQINGLLVPPKNATSMANAILNLLQNPELARTIGERARQHAREHFSVKKHVAAVQQIYQKILSEH